MYQRKVDVDMLNAVKSVERYLFVRAKSFSDMSDEELTLETSANTLFTAFNIFTSTLRWYIVRYSVLCWVCCFLYSYSSHIVVRVKDDRWRANLLYTL